MIFYIAQKKLSSLFRKLFESFESKFLLSFLSNLEPCHFMMKVAKHKNQRQEGYKVPLPIPKILYKKFVVNISIFTKIYLVYLSKEIHRLKGKMQIINYFNAYCSNKTVATKQYAPHVVNNLTLWQGGRGQSDAFFRLRKNCKRGCGYNLCDAVKCSVVAFYLLWARPQKRDEVRSDDVKKAINLITSILSLQKI